MTAAPSQFGPDQLQIVNQSVAMAEEVVSNHYKMSVNQWLRIRYDVKTLADLIGDEIVDGPFAQVIRYEGKRRGSQLGSETYDFYKICLQDHAILDAVRHFPALSLGPFSLYIIAHELIHIVRFSRFLQSFDATEDERLAEEARVHAWTHQVLQPLSLPGLDAVFDFYNQWRAPLDRLS